MRALQGFTIKAGDWVSYSVRKGSSPVETRIAQVLFVATRLLRVQPFEKRYTGVWRRMRVVQITNEPVLLHISCIPQEILELNT